MVRMPKRRKPEPEVAAAQPVKQQSVAETLSEIALQRPQTSRALLIMIDTRGQVDVAGVNNPTTQDILGIIGLGQMQIFTQGIMPLVPQYLAQVHEKSRQDRIRAPLVSPNGAPIQSMSQSESAGAAGPT